MHRLLYRAILPFMKHDHEFRFASVHSEELVNSLFKSLQSFSISSPEYDIQGIDLSLLCTGGGVHPILFGEELRFES